MLPLVCLVMLSFMACQKETSTTQAQEEIAGITANKQEKFTVCHFDPNTGKSKSIQVTSKQLPGHLAHGDLQGECSEVVVTICDQDWMLKNLDVATYRNGDAIPEVTDPTAWIALTTGAWCYFDNNSANGPIYGRLYNWYAVNDPRGLAPTGWHVPSHDEWVTLRDCLGGQPIAGGKLKSTGTIEDGTGLWYAPNTAATNSSGFTALPGGHRVMDGSFYGTGLQCIFWTSTGHSEVPIAWYRFLGNEGASIAEKGSGDMIQGFSVRCIRD